MITHPFTSNPFRIKTGERKIYDDYCGGEKDMFEQKHHLFCISLVYGILHNKKSTKQQTDELVTLSSILDENTKNTVEIVSYLLDDGEKDEKQIFKEILEFADGGLEELNELFKKNHGSFNMPSLIADSLELWNKQLNNLNNINLD